MTQGAMQIATVPRASSARAIRWLVAIGALTMVVIGVVLLYLLMQATNNP